MTYNLNNYRHAMVTDAQRWEARIGHEDRVALATKLVQASECPCIVAAHIIGELYGFDERLNQWIEKLEQFTSTNRVIGRPNETNQ